jgi:prepilin-type processing-associated H-X9-DG protein
MGPRAERYAFSYSVNELMCRIAPATTIRLSQIRRASEKILLVDEAATTINDGCWAWPDQLGQGLNVLSNRHDKRAEHHEDKTGPHAGRGNVAFIDGHVEFVDRRETYERRRYDPRW